MMSGSFSFLSVGDWQQCARWLALLQTAGPSRNTLFSLGPRGCMDGGGRTKSSCGIETIFPIEKKSIFGLVCFANIDYVWVLISHGTSVAWIKIMVALLIRSNLVKTDKRRFLALKTYYSFLSEDYVKRAKSKLKNIKLKLSRVKSVSNNICLYEYTILQPFIHPK